MSKAFTSRSLAAIRFAIVLRRSANRPVLVFPHMCVKPRNANVSGRPRPRRLTTCFDDLAVAIRAWAKGWLPTEAAAELLISHQGWLLREDFLQVAVEVGWEPFRGREIAAVDFAAAADAVQGVLPCSDGERQVLLVAA